MEGAHSPSLAHMPSDIIYLIADELRRLDETARKDGLDMQDRCFCSKEPDKPNVYQSSDPCLALQHASKYIKTIAVQV